MKINPFLSVLVAPRLPGRVPSLLWVAVVCGLLVSTAQAALFFTDSFSYTDGQNLGSATGGGGTWSGDVTQIKIAAGSAQTAPAGFAPASGLGVAVAPTTTRKQASAQFNGTTGIPVADGNVVYASFLLNVQTRPANNLRIAYLHSVAASSGAALELWISGSGQLGVQKRTGGIAFLSGTPLASPGTHLVVVRYTFQSGADEVALWLDPASNSYGAASAPTTGNYINTTATSDTTSAITLFHIESAALAAAGPVFWIDEVRVGDTWAAVTPTDGPPAPTPAPVITQALLSAQGLVLRGSNGPPSNPYQVLASTNLTAMASNWPVVSTNVFDAIGRFDSTNPVMSGTVQQFFRLVVGGANTSATNPPPPATAPAITNQPQSLTVAIGDNATFLVGASGTAPLNYFWSFNTNTPVGGNSNTLTLLNVQTNQAGSYRVFVTNSTGSVTSSVATLTVQSSPVITAQPQSQTVAVSNSVTFYVTAAGAGPLAYQWFFNTNTPVGGNSNSYTLAAVLSNNAGVYSVRVTNNFGAVTSAFTTLNVTTGMVNFTQFNLVGFGEGTTGGGIISETDPAYRKVYNSLDFATAVRDANKTSGSVKVIEIMNDLDLGWNEIDPAVKSLSSTPFTQPATPLLHPVLLNTGVSTVQLSPKTGLTIFSANGSTIRHASISIKATSNVIIRNLKFDELWEWDENTKGDYDRNNWDFIVIGVGGGTVSQVWVDHCTFTKSYDGIIDTKGGAANITYSWNKYSGDDGATNPNSFVWQPIMFLESNPAAYPMYNFLRTRGFSTNDIFQVIQGPDKTHAIGELSLDPVNVNACVTFHHQWYINCWDRLPRLAGGTVHNFNIYADISGALDARRLRDVRYSAMSSGDKTTFDNNYNFKPPLNGSISTEDGAMLSEKSYYKDCLWPLRNNQTDPNDPIYTGKIKALDTIYSFRNSNGTTNYVRGDSTDPGNPLGPFQATIKLFSWNTNAATPNGQLPYTCTMDEPDQVPTIVSSPTEGAGSGVLNWNKTNWLKTSY